jgi:hypothetical protein
VYSCTLCYMAGGNLIAVLFVIWQRESLELYCLLYGRGKVYSCTLCYMAGGKFIAVHFVIWQRESV